MQTQPTPTSPTWATNGRLALGEIVASAPASATVLAIDPASSRIGFTVKEFRFYPVRGRFGRFRGLVVVDEADPRRSSVRVEIDAASVATPMKRRDADLRSANFLDVARHPTIAFRSTRVEASGRDRLRVLGGLTIRGITRAVTLDVAVLPIEDQPGTVRYRATVAIDRRDFGLTKAPGFLVGERVEIALDVLARPAFGDEPAT